MSARRVTLYPNKPAKGKDGEGGKLVAVPDTMEEFLRVAGDATGMEAKLIFAMNGAEVDEVDVIRDDDTLYVSAGEPFARSKGGVLQVKVVCIGGGGVGKSALTLRYVKAVFVEMYDATIEDAYRKQTNVDGTVIMLDVTDTAGQDEFASMRSTWMTGQDAVLFVFDVTNRRSLEALMKYHDEYRDVTEGKVVPLVVVGNKTDLTAQRVVKASEARDLATSFGAHYVETSAKTGEGVDDAYEAVIREVMKVKQVAPKKKRKLCTIV